MGGWLGGWTNIDNKANISPAELRCCRSWAELGKSKKSVVKKYKQIVQKLQEYCKKFITKLLDSLATVIRLVKKLSEIYDAVHGMGQPTYTIEKYYLTRISGPSNFSTMVLFSYFAQ